MICDYRNLEIWKNGYDYCKLLYKYAEKLPELENNNMKSQMRRAALSLPLNIAEGSAMRTNRSFYSHLNYSLASARELECILMLCKDFKYVTSVEFDLLKKELDKFASGLVVFMREVGERCKTESKQHMKWSNWQSMQKETGFFPKEGRNFDKK